MEISLKERNRRYSAIRELMRKEDLDSLLIYGWGDHFYAGNMRYVTNFGTGGGEQFCVFPLQGEPILISRPTPGLPKFRRVGWVNRFSVTSNLFEEINRELSRFHRGNRIGTVGIEKGSAPSFLILDLPYRDKLVDATDIFRQLRLVKCPEEIEKIRVSASIADKVFNGISDMAKPGISDFAVYGEVKHIIYEMGCDKSFDIIDAEGAKMNHSYPTGDILEAGSTLAIEISPCYRGYYAQLPVAIPVGGCPKHLKEMVSVWEKAIEAGVNVLRSGVKVCDVYNTMEGVIKKHGYAMLARAGHSLGLDLVDFFSVTESEDTELKTGMTLVLHPNVQLPDSREGDGIFMGYTYLITETGAEKLNKVNLMTPFGDD